jgi:hypothetical protein
MKGWRFSRVCSGTLEPTTCEGPDRLSSVEWATVIALSRFSVGGEEDRNVPLVLATGAPTASGHSYNDIVGKQYEFPIQYRNLMVSGEPFVYYMGRRGAPSGQPVYFGSGIVGSISPSSNHDQLIALVHDVRLFDTPISAKTLSGTYLETGSARSTNWTSGVRRIDEKALARILGGASEEAAPVRPHETALPKNSSYAGTKHASALERYSVNVALTILTDEYGEVAVREMPPGNPGYDILVTRKTENLHVEVKGTVLADPVFHLSEGQRRHADARGASFRLIVVYSVDQKAQTHRVAVLDGPLDATKVDLQTEAWTGRVL